jgi:hypothetical protein
MLPGGVSSGLALFTTLARRRHLICTDRQRSKFHHMFQGVLMKTRTLVAALCSVVLVSGVATAEKIATPSTGDAIAAGDCVTDGYTPYFGSGGAIPDDDDIGFTAGVVTDDDGLCIDDVILGVDIAHTWVGDLRIWLSYDRECDGTADIGPVAALCRPNLDGCEGDGFCCGCSDDIGGLYLFSDDTSPALGEPCSDTGFAEPGCYGMAPDSPGPLALFDGEAKGGCFELYVADSGGGDTGFVEAWTVYVLDGACEVPIESTSWSTLKEEFTN